MWIRQWRHCEWWVILVLFAFMSVACPEPELDDTPPVETHDGDNDGFEAIEDGGADCDDDDPDVNPAADESCDNVDNNCDGRVDEGVQTENYPDDDGDGFGDSSRVEPGCATQDGWVDNGDDCDDTRDTVYPGADEVCDELDNDCDEALPDGGIDEDATDALESFADQDGDGYGDSGQAVWSCSIPPDHVVDNEDCDDADPGVNPAAEEVCETVPGTPGIDNDCDGLVDEGFDLNGDGSPDCQGIEVCDGVDNNENGLVDEGFDEDADGYTPYSCECGPDAVTGCGLDCDDRDDTVSPDGVEVCDGQDNDCDAEADGPDAEGAQTWYQDVDADGYGTTGSTIRACTRPDGYSASSFDCDDADAQINPAAAELCDHADNDCDTVVDEGLPTEAYHPDRDGDGYGAADESVTDCEPPEGYLTDASDCNDSTAIVNPGTPEACDHIDNNCNDEVDEGIETVVSYPDADGDGFGDEDRGLEDCTVPPGYIEQGGDCDDSAPDVNPAATEVCDAGDAEIDNDCDGTAGAGADGAPIWYADRDEDGYGTPDPPGIQSCNDPSDPYMHYATNPDDCDDGDPETYPGADEFFDNKDNDCDNEQPDGGIDEGLFDAYLEFDGIDDFAVIPPELALEIQGPITLEAWIRIDGEVSSWHAALFNKWGDTANDTGGVALEYLSSTGTFGLFVSSNGRDIHQATGVTTVEQGRWYHVAGVYDGSKLALYLDGILEAETSYDRGIYDNGLGFLVGALNPEWTSGNYALNGAILEARISTGAIYSGPFDPPLPLQTAPSTLLLLKLDECNGQLIFDSSSAAASGHLGSNDQPDDSDPLWQCPGE